MQILCERDYAIETYWDLRMFAIVVPNASWARSSCDIKAHHFFSLTYLTTLFQKPIGFAAWRRVSPRVGESE
jgi:hypothetical protein